MALSILFPLGILFSLLACILIVGYAFTPQFKRLWENMEARRKKLAEQRKQKAEKELAQLKEDLRPPVAVDQSVPAVPPATTIPYKDLKELAVRQGIEIEIGRKALESNQRVVISKGRIHIPAQGRLKQDLFTFDFRDNLYYINPKLIIVQQGKKGKPILKLFYDILYAEPLDNLGNPIWDQDFENILTDDAMDQYIIACTYQGQFELTPQVIKLIIITFVLVLGFGVALNAGFHFIPETNIHWVNH